MSKHPDYVYDGKYATAEQLASAVYAALTVDAEDYFTTPDDVETISVRGWKLRIFDDTDEFAPHGLSWWLDSPEWRGEVSDGWEMLPADQVGEEAAKLAAYLQRHAGVTA